MYQHYLDIHQQLFLEDYRLFRLHLYHAIELGLQAMHLQNHLDLLAKSKLNLTIHPNQYLDIPIYQMLMNQP